MNAAPHESRSKVSPMQFSASGSIRAPPFDPSKKMLSVVLLQHHYSELYMAWAALV